MEKKIYVVEDAPFHRLFTESREKALELWTLLSEGQFAELHSEHDWNDAEKFYWSKPMIPRMLLKTVYLHENEEKAKEAKENFEKAKKVGLISKKKKNEEDEEIIK